MDPQTQSMRLLLAQHDASVPPVLRDAWGAPTLPYAITGSISHKDRLAVGVAWPDDQGRIGVDLERCSNKAAAMLGRRVLTADEQKSLGRLEGVDVEEEVRLSLSLIYIYILSLYIYI
jgi:4'-phosphopantetheinyl transferase EntD